MPAPSPTSTYTDKFTLAAWINPSSPSGGILSRSIDVSDGTDYLRGYGIYLKDGKVQVNLSRAGDDKPCVSKPGTPSN